MASSAAMLPMLPTGGAPQGEGAPGAEGFTPTGTDADFDAVFGSGDGGSPADGSADNGDGEREYSLEEMLVDKATLTPEELEAAGLAEEGATPTPKKPAPAAKPATTAASPEASVQLMMVQQMQAMQQQNQEFQARMLEMLRPAPKEQPASKFDISSVLPENLRGIDGVPQLAQAIYSQVEKQFADRDQAQQTTQQKQQHEQAVAQWVNEARQVSTEVLKDGYKFANPQDAQHFGAMVRDLAISMADAKGGSPAQFLGPIRSIIKAGIQAQMAHLGEKTKASMQRRVPNAQLPQSRKPGAPAPQQGDAAYSVPDMNSRPTPEELRAVRMTGSQSAMEGDHSVRLLRARRARGQGAGQR
jgi:hypothetical protein